MSSLKKSLLLAVIPCLIALPEPATAEEASGYASLVINPPVMVYLDRQRIGMSPVIRREVSAGEHELALLLILPNGNRLRANYRLMIASGQETVASLNLVRDAPVEGEVRTIAPPAPASAAPPLPPQPPQPANPPPPQPANPTPPGGSWATNPGHPPTAPVAVAPAPVLPTQPQPPPPPPPPPEPDRGLSREMVREGLEALRQAVIGCMGNRTGVIQIAMTIQPDGGVSDVQAQGVYRGTGVDECLIQALPEEAAFPIYNGDPISVVYPYRVSE